MSEWGGGVRARVGVCVWGGWGINTLHTVMPSSSQKYF